MESGDKSVDRPQSLVYYVGGQPALRIPLRVETWRLLFTLEERDPES